MQTIRGRIAVWYAVGLGATIFIFGIIVYTVERSSSLSELEGLVRLETDLIAAILGEAYRARDAITTLDPQTGRLALSPDVAALLENVPAVVAVVAAAGIASVQLRPGRLISSMLLTAPFVIAASWVLGFFLSGRTFAPVDNIVDEVQAISDGRSLHRRLATPHRNDELAKLTLTLNAMLGRLETSFVTLRRFTADASHELKTPLTVLRSGIERSITHPEVPRDVMATLEEILLEVNRMTEMVDSLLTLARVDEGRAPLHLDDVDFRDLLMELAETAGFLGEQASVDVEVAVPRNPVMMRVDRGRVRQLVMNLLTNAMKYTAAGGSVTVRSEVEAGMLVLRVQDTGIGIAPGDLRHIYDRFWRADVARSRTGARAGAGLGLAISKWTAEAHGGSIEVQSRPQKGTTFTVRLPLNPESDADGAADDS